MIEKIHNNSLTDILLKFSDNIFVSDCRKSLTYLQSLEIINKFVEFFKVNQVVGKTVALELPNSIESHMVMMASLLTNHTMLISPIHATIAKERYQEFGVDVVIRAKNSSTITDDNLEVVFLNKHPSASTADNFQFQGNLYLLTSGTTGQSKTFCIKHNELIGYGTTYLSHCDLQSSDRLLNLVPFFHGFGLTRILSVMSTGGSYYVAEPHELRNISKIGNFTWVSLVPSLVEFFVRSVSPDQVSKNWKFATVSAEPCRIELMQQFQDKFGVPLLAEYGCTEASVISSNQIDNNCLGSVGQVTDKTVQIVNDKIFVYPYWKEDPTWIDTGDLGFVDSQGYLTITGRAKEIIKKNGVTIYPYDLETRIHRIAGVDQAVIYPIQHGNRELIGLVYVGEITEQALETQLKQQLDKFYQPDQITQVDQIPRFGNKIRRLEMKNHVKTFF